MKPSVHTMPHDADIASRGTHRSYRLAMIATAVLLCLPVAMIPFPPLADYPNHLARAFILHSYDSSAFFQSIYVRSFQPAPNVACDVILVFLMKLLPPEAAGHVFLALVVLTFVAGCHVLGRGIHGTSTWLALPCSFLVYSSTFFYGFVNYVLGVALFCVALGLWLEWRTHWSPARFFAVLLMILAAYLAHLTAYAFLGIACVTITAWDAVRNRTSIRASIISLIPLAPPLVAFTAFMNGDGSVGRVLWNTLPGKLVGLLTPIVSYSRVADTFVALTLLLVAVATFRATRVSVRTPTFAVGVLFLCIFLIAPITLLTASAVDVRFMLPATLLMIMSLRIDATPVAGRNLLLCVIAIAGIRLAAITREWVGLSNRAGTQVRSLIAVPSNTRIYAVFAAPMDGNEKRVRAFTQLAHYATIRRQAFVPSLFAFPGQQPLVYRDQSDYVRGTVNNPDWRPSSQLRDYDYLWSYGLSAASRRAVAMVCRTVESTDEFVLCRITKDGQPAP